MSFAVGDIVEARVYCTVLTQTSINVRHYVCTAKAGTGCTDQELADVLSTAFAAPYKALMSASSSYRGVGIHRLLPAPPGLETFSIIGQGIGTVAGDLLPKQTAGLITLRSLFSGKSFRGRVYIPFPGETDNGANSAPIGGYVTRLGTLATEFMTVRNPGAGGNTCQFVAGIFSRKLQIESVITSFVAKTIWGTQRKRGDFGRLNASPI